MISHEHKFIFIFQHKCASSSVRVALENVCQFNLSFHRGVLSKEYSNNELVKYSDYIIFANCRNPYERVVSAWKYLQREFPPEHKRTITRGLSFKDTLLDLPEREKGMFDYAHITECQTDCILNSSGASITDMIIKFENLQEDFNNVCDTIGIPRQQLPHKLKTNHKHYTEYYDDETRQIVAERYAKDIEYFGYKFGE